MNLLEILDKVAANIATLEKYLNESKEGQKAKENNPFSFEIVLEDVGMAAADFRLARRALLEALKDKSKR